MNSDGSFQPEVLRFTNFRSVDDAKTALGIGSEEIIYALIGLTVLKTDYQEKELEMMVKKIEEHLKDKYKMTEAEIARKVEMIRNLL